MRTASFKVVPYQGGWAVDQDGSTAGPYLSKEAALEALLGPLMNELKRGSAVSLTIPGSAADESALGTPTT